MDPMLEKYSPTPTPTLAEMLFCVTANRFSPRIFHHQRWEGGG